MERFSEVAKFYRRAWASWFIDDRQMDRRLNDFIHFCKEYLDQYILCGGVDLELHPDWMEILDADENDEVDFEDLILSVLVEECCNDRC